MARIAKLLSLALTVSAVPGSSSAQAAKPAARVVLVLDASGSMRGKIGGQRKIDIARRVIRDLLRTWPRSIHLGLMAYGHRGRGCGDIQLLVPVSRPDTGRIMRIVRGLRPRGKTPLTRAVQLAAEHLRYKRAQATVILVSDGIETCKGDPCALGRALKKAGAKFVTHVIGFKVGRKARRQLRCLAGSTGGKFLAADSAKGLLGALRKTVALVKREGVAIRFHAVLKKGMKPLKMSSTWAVYRSNRRGGKQGRQLSARSGPVGVFSLKPGRYLVEARADRANGRLVFRVLAGRGEEHEVVLDAGFAILRAHKAPPKSHPGRAKKLSLGYWTVARKETGGRWRQISTMGGGERRILLNAGTYRAIHRFGQGTRQKVFAVLPGKTTVVDVTSRVAEVTFRSVHAKGGRMPARGYWSIHRETTNRSGRVSWRSVGVRGGERIKFKLPPGRYKAQFRVGYVTTHKLFEVRSGTPQTVTVAVRIGTATLKAVLEGRTRTLTKGYWSVKALDRLAGGRIRLRSIMVRSGGVIKLNLPPGEYEAHYIQGYAKSRDTFMVPSGASVQKTVKTRAGRLTCELTTPGRASGYWILRREITNRSGKVRFVGFVTRAGKKFTVVVMPGRYRVLHRRGSRIVKREVEVRHAAEARVRIGAVR